MSRPSTSRAGAAVALLGFVALAVTSAVMFVALPELSSLARAVASPAAFAPF